MSVHTICEIGFIGVGWNCKKGYATKKWVDVWSCNSMTNLIHRDNDDVYDIQFENKRIYVIFKLFGNIKTNINSENVKCVM
jgi:hypothetical protein